jgi:hypothetical protein
MHCLSLFNAKRSEAAELTTTNKHTPQIVHAITGVVRSPLMTTLMQVASRLLLTWGIANIAPIAQNHYFLASMVRLAPIGHLSTFALSLLYPHISPSLGLAFRSPRGASLRSSVTPTTPSTPSTATLLISSCG